MFLIFAIILGLLAITFFTLFIFFVGKEGFEDSISNFFGLAFFCFVFSVVFIFSERSLRIEVVYLKKNYNIEVTTKDLYNNRKYIMSDLRRKGLLRDQESGYNINLEGDQ